MGGQALVPGGGGVAGIAWTTGLPAGLAGHGQDLTGADLVIGTSAGAAIGENPLAPSTRSPAAEAGRAQGAALTLSWT
jgi:hypothetical protein